MQTTCILPAYRFCFNQAPVNDCFTRIRLFGRLEISRLIKQSNNQTIYFYCLKKDFIPWYQRSINQNMTDSIACSLGRPKRTLIQLGKATCLHTCTCIHEACFLSLWSELQKDVLLITY